ncbi:uncharacterized protein LOC125779110 isoform X2 [Bactrocera dorsalis]|uniref:ribonuclease H n=1 Tax=Bactrocera dorsalis TaxID=27457 RepID=A0ABM3K2B7_BACDO|nr:uncharacterized protein LOC125779110 isoform X2 [Bactrocera dorsalis]
MSQTKIPQFQLPALNGTTLTLSPTAKYLGVEIDAKLFWKINIEKRINKAYMAFYTCKRIVSNWGLKPSIIMWMYTAVIRPILTYGALVWWPALNKQYNIRKLNGIQKAACAGVTGAIRSCPTDALNVILHQLPIDFFIQKTAAIAAIRIEELGGWNQQNHGHSVILNKLTINKSDYILPKLDFNRHFQVRIPSRREWRRGSFAEEGTTSVYTDGSKMDCGVGTGVFSADLGISLSIRLPNSASIFQAEVLGIEKACEVLLENHGNIHKATIFTDSQAALLPLSSPMTNSSIVHNCKRALSSIKDKLQLNLIWVPGYRNIFGNEKADELAKAGAFLNESEAELIPSPLGTIKGEINRQFQQIANNRWKNITKCVITKQLWPTYDRKRTNDLLNRSRKSIYRITATTTGHWPFGENASKMGMPYNDICRGCGVVGNKETIFHFLCECPALAQIRHKTLGIHQAPNLEWISTKSISDISSFIETSK